MPPCTAPNPSVRIRWWCCARTSALRTRRVESCRKRPAERSSFASANGERVAEGGCRVVRPSSALRAPSPHSRGEKGLFKSLPAYAVDVDTHFHVVNANDGRHRLECNVLQVHLRRV